MKKIITIIYLALSTTLAISAETEKVCVDKIAKDGKPILDKTGKKQQECKEIKVHKKLDGIKVPEKK